MQKKLLTLAVAGALAAPGLALAQMSGTEVYGTVNAAFGNFKYSEGTAARTLDGGTPGASQASVSKWDVANGASNYGVRSRESLGGGLSGWVQIEQNAPLERSNNVSTTPASRNTAIGIQGGFGNFFMGQWTTPWADLDALWAIGNVFTWGPVTSVIGPRETTGAAPNPACAANDHGSAGGGPMCDAVTSTGGVNHPFWRRPSNAIFYQSNVMAGVQAKLAYQTNEGKATSNLTTNANASMWSGSVQWSGMGGRARVGGAIDRHKDFTSIGSTDSGYAVKGGWNFGFLDVGLAYERITYKCTAFGTGGGLPALCASAGDVRVKHYGVALAVPVGPGSIRASYAVAKDLEGVVGTAGTHVSDTGAKEFNVGYEHRFSKRTNVGVGYAKIDNKANANYIWTGQPPNQTGVSNGALFGSDVSTFFLSMTHRF